MKKVIINVRKNYANLHGLGFILLFFGISAIINSILLGNPSQIFWGCYIGLILMGWGLVIKNGKLIGTQICILAIPAIIWNIDFFYRLITGNPLTGLTNYMFDGGFTFPKFISLQHLFAVPVGLYALAKIKTERFNFWKIAFLQTAIIFVLVLTRTDAQYNVNCVFNPCINLPLNFPYIIQWFLVYYIMILLTNLVISIIPVFRKNN